MIVLGVIERFLMTVPAGTLHWHRLLPDDLQKRPRGHNMQGRLRNHPHRLAMLRKKIANNRFKAIASQRVTLALYGEASYADHFRIPIALRQMLLFQFRNHPINNQE